MRKNLINVEICGRYYRVGERLHPVLSALAVGVSSVHLKQCVHENLGLSLSCEECVEFLSTVLKEQRIVVRWKDGRYFLHVDEDQLRNQRPHDDAIRGRLTLIPECLVRLLSRRLVHLFSWQAVFFVSVLSAISAFQFFMSEPSLRMVSAWKGAYSRPLDLPFHCTLFALMLASYVIHELRHCAASASCGIKPGRIGFGFYWMFPVFFSDVTRVWIATPKNRVRVDCGGVYFQGVFVAALMLSSTYLAAGWKDVIVSAVFLNLLSMALSVNPMMRYDGYWAVADALDEPALSRLARESLVQQIRGAIGVPSTSAKEPLRRSIWVSVFAWVSLCYQGIFIWIMVVATSNAVNAAGELMVMLSEDGSSSIQLGSAILRVLPLVLVPWVARRLVRRFYRFVCDIFCVG